MMPATLPPSRCAVCGARLPGGTPSSLCPFCVADDTSGDSPARVLGDCALIEEIGRGGMGVVWRARQRGLNRDVAVKTLPGGDLAGTEARARFRSEAQATARLKHPNIVPVHEVGEEDGIPFLVMELVEGRPLSEVLHSQPAPAKLAARWLRDVALAVQHAHENGVLHRDLKPSNILIETGDDGGRPRVTDFGLAKLADAEHSLTRTGSAVGSPAYMPPEQARSSEYTARSDIYSLGAVLYCALTGRSPFQGESIAAVLAQVEVDEPITPRRLHAGIPIDLETICLKCLEKNPARRYATARELADDLTRFLGGELVLARPVGAFGRVIRSAARHPWRAAAVGLALAMILGAGLGLERNARLGRHYNAALKQEQAATQLALMRAQLGEARAILRLRLADSRSRAEAIVQRILDQNPPAELRNVARDVLLAAGALPSARHEPLLGDGVITDDWTMACGDMARSRWALATYEGIVSVRRVDAETNVMQFSVAPRTITALIGFSPGGRWLASRHRTEFCIWDTQAGATQRLAFVANPWREGRRFSFNHIAFSPDDRAVLWLDRDSIVANSLPDGAEIGRWRGDRGTAAGFDAVAFDPKGGYFAAASAETPLVTLRAWPGGEVRREFSGWFSVSLCALALSAGAEHIAGGDKNGRITSWRGDGTSRGFLEWRGHEEMIRGMRFSEDGRLLAATSEEGMLRVWDRVAGEEIAKLNLDSATLGFSPDNRQIGVGYGAGRLTRVRLESAPLLHSFRPESVPEVPQFVSFLPDGGSIACLGAAEVLRCSVPDGRVLERFPFPHPHAVQAESALGGGLIICGMEGVHRHALSPSDTVSVLFPPARWGWDASTISADGRWMAASDNAGARAVVWPVGSSNASLVRTVRTSTGGSGKTALSPDGSQLALALRYDPGLTIYSVERAEVLRRFELPARHSLAWSPDGLWLAACGTTAPLWNAATWMPAPLPFLEPNYPPAGDVTFSAPENGVSKWMAVVTGNSRITILDPSRRAILATLEAPAGRTLYKLDFSPDNRWLAAAGARGEVQLWDMALIRTEFEGAPVAAR